MAVTLTELGDNFKKRANPGCCICAYDADVQLTVRELERFFCEECLERALMDVLLDSMRAFCAPSVG